MRKVISKITEDKRVKETSSHSEDSSMRARVLLLNPGLKQYGVSKRNEEKGWIKRNRIHGQWAGWKRNGCDKLGKSKPRCRLVFRLRMLRPLLDFFNDHNRFQLITVVTSSSFGGHLSLCGIRDKIFLIRPADAFSWSEGAWSSLQPTKCQRRGEGPKFRSKSDTARVTRGSQSAFARHS